MNRPSKTPQGAEAIERRAWRALGVAAAGYVLVGFNSTATNLAFGAIAESFADQPESRVSWTVTAYFIGTAAFLPLGGRLADRYGHDRIFLGGLLGFVLSALCSASAPSLWFLIAARALQAIAGALLIPASLSLVLPEFPESRRATAVATWAAAGPLSAALAPSTAAAVLGAANWRVLYLLTAPIAAITAVAGLRIFRRREPPPSTAPLDVRGAVIGTLALALAVLAVSEGTNWGWTSPRLIGVAVAAAALTPIFIRRCQIHPEPLLNLGLFRIYAVWLANLANGLISLTSLSIWLVWPLFLHEIWDYSPFQVGLAITAGPLGAGPAALVAGRLSDRFGPRWLFTAGTLVSALATAWAVLWFDTEPNYWLRMFPSIIGFGTGWGLSSPVLNSWALSQVEERFWGEANAAFNTLRNVAAAIGVAVVLAILAAYEGPDELFGYRLAFAVMVVPVALSFATLAIFARSSNQPARGG